MPIVLHSLPPDASLRCYGLEDWIDSGRGFMPRLVASESNEAWRLYPRVSPPAATDRWARLVRWATRKPWHGNGWVEVLAANRIGLVHLHTLEQPEELIQAARRLDVPVVLSWPRGGRTDFPFWQVDRVLVPTPAVADALREAGCPEGLLRLAPPPLSAGRSRRGAAARGQPLQWVTAAHDEEGESLEVAVAAFERFAEAQTEARLRVLTGARLAEAASRRWGRLGERVAIEVVESAGQLRTSLADAHLAVFPLLTRSDGDAGLTWPAWVAASLGLPMVLGREAAADGVLDSHHALLAAPEAEALGGRMQFLAQRPYVWHRFGAEAAAFAAGRLAYERACEIPLEVYRQLLGTRSRAAHSVPQVLAR